MSNDEETESRDEESTVHDAFSSIAQADHSRRATLLIHTRNGAQAVSLLPSASVVLGRGRSADVTIGERTLSREHCRFRLIGNDVWVEDLESTNGTRVGGKRIERQYPLSPGDEVDLGPVRVALHVTSSTEAQPRALESHDRFVAVLEEELVRARTCNRKVGLVMVRTTDPDAARLGRWSTRIWTHLHPFERAALYSLDAVEILLPDTTTERPLKIAEAITGDEIAGEAPLLCGVALYPDAATSLNELLEVTRRASRRASAARPVMVVRSESEAKSTRIADAAAPDDEDERPVVSSAAMTNVFETAHRVARATIPVLIQGETGVGKEIVAREIHAESKRKGPLRCINCGAIPGELIESVLFGHEKGAFTGAGQRQQGVFEATSDGTLLLDEIGELPASAQSALLRVLETKRITRVGSNKEVKVDVRILAATHRDLEAMCEGGGFRRDLLFRLNAMTLQIPPLRDRSEDIEPLVRSFVRLANRANGCRVSQIESEAIDALVRFDWPGNVRELRNVIERAVVIAQENTIAFEDLPDRIRRPKGLQPGLQPAQTSDTAFTTRMRAISPPEVARSAGPLDGPATAAADSQPEPTEAPPFKEQVRHYEAAVIREALEGAEWDKGRTATLLQLPRRTLQHKIRVHDIAPEEPAQNVWALERAVGMPAGADDEPLVSRVQRFEIALIERTLAAAGGNTPDAADRLQMPLRTLQHKIRTLDVSKPPG